MASEHTLTPKEISELATLGDPIKQVQFICNTIEHRINTAINEFAKLQSIKWMSVSSRRYLPKAFLTNYAVHDISNCWEILPIKFKADSEMYLYKHCTKHFTTIKGRTEMDENDGPTPLVKNCPACQST